MIKQDKKLAPTPPPPPIRFKQDDGSDFPDWEERRLGEVVTKVSSDITLDSLKELRGAYAVYGAAGEVKKIDFFRETEPYVAIVKDGAVGKIHLCSPYSSVLGTLDIIKPKKEKINVYFLYSVLQRIVLSKYIIGSVIPHIYFKDYSQEKILLPSLSEQQKIASFLQGVDTKIQLLERKVVLLQSYKKGIMQKFFSQKLRFKDEQGNDYPDWEERKIGEVADIIGGGTPDTSNKKFWEKGNITWFIPSEIKQKYTKDSMRKITEEGMKASSVTILPAGTLLLTTRATIGDVGIATRECTTNQGFQNLIVKKGYDNEFIYYWILNNRNTFIKLASGSTFLEISKKSIQNITITLPSLSEQQKIASFLQSLDTKISLTQKQVVLTKLYKKGLLQRMFVLKLLSWILGVHMKR